MEAHVLGLLAALNAYPGTAALLAIWMLTIVAMISDGMRGLKK